MAKNIVIGIGNLLFKDDGVGVIAAHYLKENFNYEPELELLDGGTLGLNLIEYFLEYDNVFIIDTISIDDNAGSIYKIPSNELLGTKTYKNTAHEVEVVQMLESCELYDKKADITVFGVVPQDITTTQIGLSETLYVEFDKLIKTVNRSIGELGVKVSKKSKLDLDDIIGGLA